MNRGKRTYEITSGILIGGEAIVNRWIEGRTREPRIEVERRVYDVFVRGNGALLGRFFDNEASLAACVGG